MAKIINTKQKRSKKYRQGRLVAIAAIAAAVLLVVGGIIYNHFFQRENVAVIESADDSYVKDLQSKTDLIQMTIERNQLDYGQSYEKYSKLVDELKSPNEKRSALLNQASFAINQGQYDDAFAVAKKADEIYSDDGSLTLIARIYEYKNNKQGALDYYKKAREYYQDNPPKNQAESVFLEEAIKLLEEAS